MYKSARAPAIHFGRACTFYVSLPSGSLFFNVEIKCYKALDSLTGMSVNLSVFDSLTQRIFKNSICKTEAPIKFLNKKVLQLQRKLHKFETQVIAVKFTEARNFGVNFCVAEDATAQFFRHDFAVAANKDLYGVISYFNHLDQVTKIRLYNFRSKASEEITF